MAEKLYDIFISYSSKDAKVINALCHYLEERNLRCFVAYRDVPYGQDWGPYIIRGIKDAKAMVYVHTEASNNSKETTREINLAFKYECEIIPFKIDSIEYIDAKEYRLTDVNWLDAFPEEPSAYFETLYKRLEKHFPERTEEDRLRIKQELKQREEEREAEDKKNLNKSREERDRALEEEALNAGTNHGKLLNTASIEFRTDSDCDIFKADEIIASVEQKKSKVIQLRKGKHLLVCRSYEFSDIEQEVIVEVGNDLADDFIKIELADKVKARQDNIAAKKSEKLKREKEIEAQKKLEELLKEQQKKEAEERRREAERRERERRKREEEARRRREERERRKEEFKAWWKKNQSKVWGILAAVAFIWIVIIAVDSCEGTTETATETAVETITEEQNVIEVVETPAMEIQEETWINEEEVQRQAEIERQKAKERKIKEEQERKRQEEERKRQAEEKKKQDEAKFNEYKDKGDEYFSKFLANPDERFYKVQAIKGYELALQYKEDAEIRDRYNKLIKEK